MAGCSATVTVLCEAPKSSVTETSGGYQLRAFRQHSRKRLRISAELRKFLADSPPPDVAVLNGIFIANVAHVARILRRRGIPYVHAPHDPYNPAIFARDRHIKIPHWWFLERPLASRCGVVVAPTVTSIRSGLEELLERRDEWARMGKAGRAYVLENLEWDQIARRALDGYRKLIDTGS